MKLGPNYLVSRLLMCIEHCKKFVLDMIIFLGNVNLDLAANKQEFVGVDLLWTKNRNK